MLIGRFKDVNGREFYGSLYSSGATIIELENPNDTGSKTGETFSLQEVQILPPCLPTKILCVGLNYRDHAEEFHMPIPDEPVLFLKPPTAVTAHKSPIIYPAMSKRVDYEAELAVVIGKVTKQISKEKAPDHILGFTCANDITARDLQQKDGQWTRAKSFDTFLPLGPYISTELDPSQVNIRLDVNGERRQFSSTRNLIFNVNELVSFASHIMTLLPGDVILTGTPSGVGPLKIGDVVQVTIEGIGSLENYVIS